ncbi:MAG: PQQ-dependent sugar dehydrogenase [Phycisphaerales bacterium]
MTRMLVGTRHAPIVPGVAGALLAVCTASAQTPLKAEVFAENLLAAPVMVTHAPGDFARVFVVELDGHVEIVKDGTLLPTPFLDISSRVAFGGAERGMYSMAFDPGYAVNGFFYVNYLGPDPEEDTIIERYRVSGDPDIADPTSAELVLRIPQPPTSIHKGGWMGFGPDGYLHVSTGDGGPQCDPSGNAQNLGSLLGKMLRLDVSSLPYSIPPSNPFAAGGGRGELWAYGLRNPWRCSFDRASGDLWITDVGQGAQEEINVRLVAEGPPIAPNYGWNCREGFICATVPPGSCFNAVCPPGCASRAYVDPIHSYTHASGCAITGGYVYRGCAIPDLRGAYFFGDLCAGSIWSLRYDGKNVTELIDRTAELLPAGGPTIALVIGFGEDALGELYIGDASPRVWKIVPDEPAPDCNENGRTDGCDIALGFSPDINGNGVPDECEEVCYPDCNSSGSLTVADFGCFQSKYALNHPYADCNVSGSLSIADFGCFQSKFVLACP